MKRGVFEDVFGRHVATAATTLPPEVTAAARERSRTWGNTAEPVPTLAAAVTELLTESKG